MEFYWQESTHVMARKAFPSSRLKINPRHSNYRSTYRHQLDGKHFIIIVLAAIIGQGGISHLQQNRHLIRKGFLHRQSLCIKFRIDAQDQNRILTSRCSFTIVEFSIHENVYLHSSLSFFESRLKLKHEHDPSTSKSRRASFSRRFCSCFSMRIRCCLM